MLTTDRIGRPKEFISSAIKGKDSGRKIVINQEVISVIEVLPEKLIHILAIEVKNNVRSPSGKWKVAEKNPRDNKRKTKKGNKSQIQT